MKNLLIALFILITANIAAQETTVKGAWLEKWENSKNYLIAIAEAMPEAQYNFKPTERQMSFKEQLLHIKGNIDWLSKTYFSDVAVNRTTVEQPKTKAEVITMLTLAFDRAHSLIKLALDKELINTVSFFSGPKSKIQILNLLQDHVSHHRGQLIVYLNLNQVEPPEFVGW